MNTVNQKQIIIILIDSLGLDRDWRHLTRKKIDSKSLMDFILGGFSWETIMGEDGIETQIKVRHDAKSSFFAVMSNWREYPLLVNGQERKMVIGNIHALGRLIDYFLEEDLKTFSERLRLTN